MSNFRGNMFEIKSRNDLTLFKEIVPQYIEESEYPVFTASLSKVYTLLQTLYEETNVVPKSSLIPLRNKAKLETITENEISDMVYRNFRSDLDKNFVNPLIKGNLQSIYENEMGNILKIIVGSKANLDPEISKKYSIFEKVFGDSIKELILPRDNELEMASYVSKLDPGYFNIFDRNIREIKHEFNEEINKLIGNLANRMFKKCVQFDDDADKDNYKIEDYKGLSTLFKNDDAIDTELKKFPELEKVDEDEAFEEAPEEVEEHKEGDEENKLENLDIDSIINK